ncbi:hypothetical protein, partial [Rugosimonospora africana]|uniref:hypothetical protein n=1 Tax=Rugosimonospora africana TaxID=556532 RepID=UPI00194068DC
MDTVEAGGGRYRRVRRPRRVRRRRTRLGKALMVVALVLSVVVLALFAGGLFAINRLNHAVVPGNLLGTARAPRG